ncbi:MAG: peptidoglycan-associated lipoprotein Pal [Thermomonas sp.]|uniref:peptidoglycan-associated lipoprotein Pal n=1 Tax=Thermomonas sp. TaxID=1971895 RepID=UPI001EB76477|nr:peptidoglycan-associated lipoprotein Pal [Thermomonas sp.]MBV2210031.1 peptidoglycan-associated lipoprotein Pal [Thermomonas sp.]
MAVSIPNVARVLTLAVLASAVAVGCSKKVKETPPAPQVEAPAAAPQEAPKSGVYTPADLDSDACLIQRTIYFDLDKDLVKPEFAAIMNCHAKYLRDRPSARLRLEGNADERGSREYNLGLGERRGNAVNSALQANGGSPSQLTVISYGEERPVCNDSNEACWSKNRRVELIYTEK